MKKVILLLSLALALLLAFGCQKPLSFATDGSKWRSSVVLDNQTFGICFTKDGKVIWDIYENDELVSTLNGTYENASEEKKVNLSGLTWTRQGVEYNAALAYYYDLKPSANRLVVDISINSGGDGTFYQLFDPE